MNITELKRITNALSTYASVRDKASGPEAIIGVQSKSGIIKLIAGSRRGGIVCTSQVGSTEETSFIIRARPFLSAAKTLKGKIDLSFEVDGSGLRLVTDKGGSASFPIVGSLRDSGFAKKPKTGTHAGLIYGERFSQIARLFDAIAQDIESQTPTMHYYDGKFVITAISPATHAIYASLEVEGTGEGEASFAAYMDFWRSLKTLERDGTITFGPDGTVASSGIYECFSPPWLVSPYDSRTRKSESPRPPHPWPTLGWKDDAATARVTIDRRQLIEAIKGQVPDDDLGRVTLQVDTGTFEVYAYGAEAGIKLPASTEGRGVRSLQAKYLLDMLRAFESSEVELAWGTSPAIRLHSKEYKGWTVLIAPVTMNN